jgi:protein dithiol oxidoreductase (disulfide-forming)
VMRYVPKMSWVVVLAGLLLTVPHASAAETGFDPEGKYQLIEPAQPTGSKTKVEVVELFWYACPHCFDFLPHMTKWEATKPDYVEFKRMPAVFRKSWEPHARAYYTAEVLGIVDKIHEPLFRAIHEGKRPIHNKQALSDFFAQYGVDKDVFNKTWNSFAVESMIRRSMVMQQRYGVTGTPTVVINGKYRTSASLAGSHETVIQVINALAAREMEHMSAAK